KAQKVSGYIGNLNVIIGAIVGDTLYLTQAGDSEAYLIRKRFISVVSEGLSDDLSNGDVFGSIATGKIDVGDTVLFSSTRLLRYISKTDLAKATSGNDIMNSLNEIKDTMSTEILGRVGLTGILFSKAMEAEVEDFLDDIEFSEKGVLESSRGHVSAQKETLTGKFLTAFKGYKSKGGSKLSGIGFFEKIKDFFSRFVSGLFSKGFGKDKILALLVVLIIVLGAGIWVYGVNSSQREQLAQLDEVLNGVQSKITEADTKGSYDKVAAKEVLDKAYVDAMSVLNSGYYRDKAKLFLVQIDETRDKLDSVQRVETPKVVADLTKKRSDVNALGFVDMKGRIFVYEYNALYELVLDQVQDPLTIDKDETVIAATGFSDRNAVVFLTKNGKMIQYNNGTMNFMDTVDTTFHKGSYVVDWGNKVYLLDTENSEIWKYAYKATTGGFGNAEAYFAKEKVDLAGAKSFAIDANLYVLMNNGDINKYYGGTKVDFYINNPPFNALKDPSIIYTNDKLDYVFVVDAQGRILFYQKDAKTGNLVYTMQYLFPNIGEIRDLSVDPDSKKMLILTKDKIYELNY
ncbi:hypothetical protein CO044_04420, partial [Candidatus Peregrinibacteria bacterium CG_4_9_14_0_2_um_filter_38_9]